MTEAQFVAFVEGLLVGEKTLNRQKVAAIREQLAALRATQRMERLTRFQNSQFMTDCEWSEDMSENHFDKITPEAWGEIEEEMGIVRRELTKVPLFDQLNEEE